MGKRKRNKLRVAVESELGLRGASAIAPFGAGTFLVVDDRRGLFLARAGGSASLLLASPTDADLEGLTVAPDGSEALLLCEASGDVIRVSLGGDAAAPTARADGVVGTLPRLNDERNRGWEGIAHWPSGSREWLLAVHQDRPRTVGVFRSDRLDRAEAHLELPRQARKKLEKLSDVAVCPRSGKVLVLSGRKHRIAVLSLRRDPDWELSLDALVDLPHSRDDVPEGLTFDAQGSLWLVTDGAGRLVGFEPFDWAAT